MRHDRKIMRSADEIAYEITAVYYDDDKVAALVRRAREEMRQACLNVVHSNFTTKRAVMPADVDLVERSINAIPNR
jgi:biotin carboxylase